MMLTIDSVSLRKEKTIPYKLTSINSSPYTYNSELYIARLMKEQRINYKDDLNDSGK